MKERLSGDPFGFGEFSTALFLVWVVVLLLFFLATLVVVKKAGFVDDEKAGCN